MKAVKAKACNKLGRGKEACNKPLIVPSVLSGEVVPAY